MNASAHVSAGRAFALHCARVFLAEAAGRRHSHVNRDFYWFLFASAQSARRSAALGPIKHGEICT